MLINFIDPGLNESAGHHYANADLMIRTMVDQGHRVILYCHRSIHAHVRDNLDEICRVIPIFDTFPYPRYHGEIIDYDQQVESLSQEYQPIGPADIWFFPSLFPFQLKALSSIKKQIKIFGCLHSFFDDDRWGEALSATDHLDRHLASYESVITLGLQSLSSQGRFSVLPVLEFCDPRPKAVDSLKKVGFFGCQKDAKGQHIIEDIIGAMLDRGYEVVLQDAWDRFKVHREGVTNIGFVDSLPEAMTQCDLLIFPYDINEYSRRMSGVLNYALYLGTPCIVPQGTTLAGRLPVKDCCFAKTSVDSIVATVDHVSRDFSDVSARFYSHAKSLSQNNAQEFIRQALS